MHSIGLGEKMKKKFVENIFEFDISDFDVEEFVNKPVETRLTSKEGICDECGVQGIVTKVKGKMLCDLCILHIKRKNK